MRFLSKDYPELWVHGVVKFADGIAEVTETKHIEALSKLERYGVIQAEPMPEAKEPVKRGRPRRNESTSD